MKHIKHINEITENDYSRIMNELPQIYAIFKVKKISNMLPEYIRKGDELYNSKYDGLVSIRTGEKRVDIGLKNLSFVEYLTQEELNDKINMLKNVDKYNL